MSTILVTGGAGAIGINLVKKLIEMDFKVVVLDDLSSGHEKFLPKNCIFVNGKVESEEVLKNVFSYNPEYVIHLAALFANQNSVDNPKKDLIVNSFGMVNILEFARKHNVKKLVYTSSSCVYGKRDSMNESILEYFPETPYAISKLNAERYCQFWAQNYEYNAVIVRLFNSYGPGEIPGKYRNVIPNFFKLAMSGESLTVTGDGTETRDFTFVSDTVQGIIKVLFGDTVPGEVFNIASSTSTEIQKIAKIINEITGNKAPIQFLPKRSWDHVKHRLGDIQKIKSRLNYTPTKNVEEGLLETYQWLKEVL